MISQLLNQDFLVEAAEETRLGLKGLVERRERRASGDEGDLANISSEDAREVAERLDAALTDLEASRSAKDDWICLPRDPLLSILQTLFDDAVEDEAVEPDPESPTGRRLAGDPPRRTADGRRAFGAFEVTRPRVLSDPRWLWSGVVIAWHKFKDKAEFGGLPADVRPISDNARIFLVGDWGSGIKRAQAVAAQMQVELDKGIAERREQHVIHLGDVYYTGAEKEYKERFLRYWPVQDDQDIGSYTLAGNHDMYQGGHAYYGTCLADRRFDRQEGKSVFGLGNKSWQILGLDTAYKDHVLHGDQVQWIRAQLDAAPKARTALLSHHQLFSAYEDAGDDLRPQIEDVLATGRIDAWFWAHEHRCLAYDEREKIGFASCVGHGGIPEYLIAGEGEPYPSGLRYDYRKKHGDGREPWNTFGFAVLELSGRHMTVRYIDESGDAHHKEELRA